MIFTGWVGVESVFHFTIVPRLDVLLYFQRRNTEDETTSIKWRISTELVISMAIHRLTFLSSSFTTLPRTAFGQLFWSLCPRLT